MQVVRRQRLGSARDADDGRGLAVAAAEQIARAEMTRFDPAALDRRALLRGRTIPRRRTLVNTALNPKRMIGRSVQRLVADMQRNAELSSLPNGRW